VAIPARQNLYGIGSAISQDAASKVTSAFSILIMAAPPYPPYSIVAKPMPRVLSGVPTKLFRHKPGVDISPVKVIGWRTCDGCQAAFNREIPGRPKEDCHPGSMAVCGGATSHSHNEVVCVDASLGQVCAPHDAALDAMVSLVAGSP